MSYIHEHIRGHPSCVSLCRLQSIRQPVWTQLHGISRSFLLTCSLDSTFFDSVQKSLGHLQLDVLHCHEFDLETPIHSLFGMIKVEYIEMSSSRTWQFHIMPIQYILRWFVTEQNF
ncbi:hypothetical protein DFS33DRAFT_210018 [Desarmillaria ectypa]|nr:hypothetical protein DFS33DRAFT_210018 [Desarmillaria ectypa]